MNTIEIGDAFRDDVVFLLEATNCKNLKKEVKMIHKKVDIYYELSMFGRTSRIAAECKNLSSNLTKDMLVKIYADHLPLIQKDLIDEIQVITRIPIQKEAEEFLRNTREIHSTTLNELQSNLMDFSLYIQGVKNLFEERGLNNYYIHPTVNDGKALHKLILEWIEEDGSDPIAILGGYGQGKSSYSKFLASVLATEASNNYDSRIPILIPLGEIATEQSIEGLISKHLTCQYPVNSFNMNLFFRLNARGRFVIILDGFDEMKHTLTWEQFVYNFNQINKLIDNRAKLIVLGRPSAFLTEREHLYILRGERDYNFDSGFEIPKYLELKLDNFNKENVFNFIKRYMKHIADRHLSKYDITQSFIDTRTEEIKEVSDIDLILRPVHAKMMCEIAVDPNIEIKDFSRYELYDVFIKRLLEREGSKGARHKISKAIRLRFIRELSWWLWKNNLNSFKTSDLPQVLLRKLVGNLHNEPTEEIIRELLVGSILDKKSNHYFFFSHRSYQEFLVSDYISQVLEITSKNIEEMVEHLNDEILLFLRDNNSKTNIFQKILTRINRVQSKLPYNLLVELTKHVDTPLTLQGFKPTIENPFWLMLRIITARTNSNTEELTSYFKSMLKLMGDSDEHSTLVVIYFYLVDTLTISDSPYFNIEAFIKYFLNKAASDFRTILNRTKRNKDYFEAVESNLRSSSNFTFLIHRTFKLEYSMDKISAHLNLGLFINTFIPIMEKYVFDIPPPPPEIDKTIRIYFFWKNKKESDIEDLLKDEFSLIHFNFIKLWSRKELQSEFKFDFY